MKMLYRVLKTLPLTTLLVVSLHARAHDSYGQTVMAPVAAPQSKQYNPWRPAPHQWGQHKQQRVATVQHSGHTGTYVVPLHPVQARQYEYRNYMQQVSPYYGSGGTPWWSDPVAVPYGPWSVGNGWPNGLW